MTIICLDQSTYNLGVAVFRDGKLVLSKSERLEGTRFKRLLQAKKLLESYLKKHKPDEVVLEAVYLGRSPLTYQALCQLQGVLGLLVFEKLGKPPYFVLPSTWRSLTCVTPYMDPVKRCLSMNYKAMDRHEACAILIGIAYLKRFEEGKTS